MGVYQPEEELNALTNFLLTVHEDKNILDVLQLLVSLATENPTGVAGSLSDKRGIACVFKLLNSPLEEVRINSIKLMTLILQNTKPNKKKELMDESGLWALLTDRIRRVSSGSMVHSGIIFGDFLSSLSKSYQSVKST